MSADATIFHDIHDLAEKAATRFNLPWPIVFKPLLARHRCKKDGEALNGKPPTISLRVHRYHRPKASLQRSTIMATLAHELAHLGRGTWDHGKAHRELTQEIADWLREQGQPVAWNLHIGTYPRRG